MESPYLEERCEESPVEESAVKDCAHAAILLSSELLENVSTGVGAVFGPLAILNRRVALGEKTKCNICTMATNV